MPDDSFSISCVNVVVDAGIDAQEFNKVVINIML